MTATVSLVLNLTRSPSSHFSLKVMEKIECVLIWIVIPVFYARL